MLNPREFKNISQSLWKCYQQTLNGIYNADEIEIIRNVGNEIIQCANELTQLQKQSVPEKRMLETAVANVKSTLCLLDNCKVGAGISTESEISTETDTVKWDEVESAFGGRIKTGVITNREHTDVMKFLLDAEKHFEIQVKKSLEMHNALKVNTELVAEFKIIKDDTEIFDLKYFNTKTMPIYPLSNLKKWYILNVQKPIQTDIEEFQEQESGWTMCKLISLIVKINKFNPMRGSSYIKLPKSIVDKKACINVANKDNQCFKWAILSALHPTKYNRNDPRQYIKYENELNFHGIKFPVTLNQVGKFEKQNDVSVNVYCLQAKTKKSFIVLPHHLTKQKKNNHVNLLFVETCGSDDDDDTASNEPYKFHYVWIKNLSRLVRSQLSKKNHAIHICDRCLHYFWCEEKLSAHIPDCEKMNDEKITFPYDDKILQFKNFTHKWRVPVVVYADFECLLQPLAKEKRAFQKHEAYSVGYYVKFSFDDSKSEYKSYRCINENDEEPAQWFVRNLYSLATYLDEKYDKFEPMRKLTFEEEIEFTEALLCQICNKPFNEGDIKVNDQYIIE